jgi:hypothetical protein
MTRNSLQTSLEPGGHADENVVGALERTCSGRQKLEVPAPATAALCSRFAEARADVALVLEPLERRIDRADGDFTAGARFDLAPDRSTVGIGTESQERE